MGGGEHLEADPGNFFVRLFYILAYLAIVAVVRFALWGVLLVQLGLHLMGRGPNPEMSRLGKLVSGYVYRVWLYLTYNSHERPFPFGIPSGNLERRKIGNGMD